jgi:hypothetical protein
MDKKTGVLPCKQKDKKKKKKKKKEEDWSSTCD